MTTLTARSVAPRGTWRDPPRDVVVLDYDGRHRRRMAMTGVRGTPVLLDLPQTQALRSGDALVLDSGELIEILAAPETLVEIDGQDVAARLRIAWHLGNRHLPIQLHGQRLRIRRDHVIEAMVLGLGGRLRPIEAPFDPEGGAYEGEIAGHTHGHGQGHTHSHE